MQIWPQGQHGRVEKETRLEMTDREYVESVWPNVKECDGPFICTVYSCLDSCDLERVIQELGNGKTLDKTYAAAAAFTRERLEKIRQVKEEIAWLEMSILGARNLNVQYVPVSERILAREQSAPYELNRGIKPEALL